MSEVVLFPGIREIAEVGEPEIDPEIILKLDIQLERWRALGTEWKRRVDGVPFDLALELSDLLREPLP
jgi:hypothetical protein